MTSKDKFWTSNVAGSAGSSVAHNTESYVAAYDSFSTVGALILGFGVEILYDALKEDVLENPFMNNCFIFLGIVVVTCSLPATLALTFRSALGRRLIALSSGPHSAVNFIQQTSYLSKPCIFAEVLAAFALMAQVSLLVHHKFKHDEFLSAMWPWIGGVPVVLTILCLFQLAGVTYCGVDCSCGVFLTIPLGLLGALYQFSTHHFYLVVKFGMISLIIVFCLCFCSSIAYCWYTQKEKPVETSEQTAEQISEQISERGRLLRDASGEIADNQKYSEAPEEEEEVQRRISGMENWSPRDPEFFETLLDSVQSQADKHKELVNEGLLEKEDTDGTDPVTYQAQQVADQYDMNLRAMGAVYFLYYQKVSVHDATADMLWSLKKLLEKDAISAEAWKKLKQKVLSNPLDLLPPPVPIGSTKGKGKGKGKGPSMMPWRMYNSDFFEMMMAMPDWD